MDSESVKHEWQVVNDEEDNIDEYIIPFDEDSSTNLDLDDPLADDNDEVKVEEELDDGNEEQREGLLQCQSNPSKNVRFFIIVKKKRKSVGRPRKYATEEDRRKAKAEQDRERLAKMGPEQWEEYRRKCREAARRRRAKMKEQKPEPDPDPSNLFKKSGQKHKEYDYGGNGFHRILIQTTNEMDRIFGSVKDLM